MESNWDAIQVFLGLQTQWRISSTGHRLGLEYPAIEVVIRQYDLEDDPDLFAKLQIMELEALTYWSES